MRLCSSWPEVAVILRTRLSVNSCCREIQYFSNVFKVYGLRPARIDAVILGINEEVENTHCLFVKL